MALSPNPPQSFIWGAGGARLTPEQIAREREIAQSLMGVDTSPVGHWLQGAARMANAGVGALRNYRAGQAEQTNAAENQSALSRVLGAFGGGASGGSLGGSAGTSTAMATAPAPDIASARVAQAFGDSTQPAGNLSESKQAFVSALLPAAMEESQRTGVDPRIIVAQAAQETGWGRSAPGNNYFGIKSHGQGGGQTFKTHEYVNGNRVNITDSFRSFDSPADSVRGYGDFLLNNPRYRPLMAAQGMDAQLEALQASGYATDPNYSRSVGAIARGIQLPDAVAANEAMAGGDLAAQAVQNWAAQNYAPEGVTVAETPDQIMAAEQAMASPEFSAPPAMAEPRMIQDVPVADIAASLTGANVNPDLPMMGGSAGGGFLPAQQQQAAAQQAGGFSPELIQLVSSPYVDSNTRQIAMSLLGQQMQQADPMRQMQLERGQLELEQMRNPQATLINAGGGQLYNPNTGEWISAPGGGGAGEGPAAFQTLQLRAQAAGLQPGTPEFQQFMAEGGRTQQDPAAVQRIERLTENLMATGDFVDPMQAQNIASGIVDGRLRADRHPVTGVLQVVDMATGRPAYEQAQQQPSAGDAMLSPQPSAGAGQFGQQFPNAPGSFGVEGAAQGAVNRVTDALGMGPAYPDVAQTQADFGVLRESLLNDISSSYGRQPPSWLLKEIRDLTPEAGSVFQGAGTAQTKLRALGRHLESELGNATQALQRDLSPTNRQEMEARQQGLIGAVERVNGALQSFDGQSGAPEVGTVEDGYRFKGGDPANPNSWEQVQ